LNSQRLNPYIFAIRLCQHTSQKLQKSMALPTLQTERKIKYENTTMCISNSGFSDKTKDKI